MCYKFGVKQNTTTTTVPFIPIQPLLSPALPTVSGNADYQERAQLLEFFDDLLRTSRVEADFVALCMQDFLSRANPGAPPSASEAERYQTHSLMALRTMTLKSLLLVDYRELSLQLAQSPLLRKFCLCDGIDTIHVPSKSQLHRYSTWLPHDQMRSVIDGLTRAAISPTADANASLDCALVLDVLLMDSTCLTADIHYPVDWVLLRDATRTLMGSIQWIRDHGLKNRLEAPESFLSRINGLCMAMAQAGKTFVVDSKKKRKAVLRKMKEVLNAVERHAVAHRQLLDAEWETTGVSRGRVEAVLRRMDNILEQLPAAKKQAHERIIGERQVPNAEKILSLYDGDLHVMNRGKASGDVEFGNALFLCEQSDGLIVDYKLTRETPKADVQILRESILRVDAIGCGKAFAVVTDRGFDCAKNREYLEELDLFNGMCSRDPAELNRRKQEELFVGCQERRAQTEGRVAILKNVFIGARCRAKGFENREAQVDWAVLTHNLWLLVRLRKKQLPARLELAAAA